MTGRNLMKYQKPKHEIIYIAPPRAQNSVYSLAGTVININQRLCRVLQMAWPKLPHIVNHWSPCSVCKYFFYRNNFIFPIRVRLRVSLFQPLTLMQYDVSSYLGSIKVSLSVWNNYMVYVLTDICFEGTHTQTHTHTLSVLTSPVKNMHMHPVNLLPPHLLLCYCQTQTQTHKHTHTPSLSPLLNVEQH